MRLMLRPARPDDEEFLLTLYVSTRSVEVAAFGWTAEQQAAFLHMQFVAQRRSYEAMYPSADHDIIVVDMHPIGRIMVYRGATEIHLIDIALLPEYMGQGLGSVLLRRLMEEAGASGKSVSLQVENNNIAARRMYQRLGFVQTSGDEMYSAMRWSGRGRAAEG